MPIIFICLLVHVLLLVGGVLCVVTGIRTKGVGRRKLWLLLGVMVLLFLVWLIGVEVAFKRTTTPVWRCQENLGRGVSMHLIQHHENNGIWPTSWDPAWGQEPLCACSGKPYVYNRTLATIDGQLISTMPVAWCPEPHRSVWWFGRWGVDGRVVVHGDGHTAQVDESTFKVLLGQFKMSTDGTCSENADDQDKSAAERLGQGRVGIPFGLRKLRLGHIRMFSW